MNGTQTPDINGQGSAAFCSNPSATNTGICVPAGAAGSTFVCQPNNIIGNSQRCQILPHCTAPSYPAPASCVPNALVAIGAGCLVQFITSGPAGCGVYLPAGAWVFIPTAAIAASISTTNTFFSFSASGASGFISMIGIAVGIVSLAGLVVFGSGEQGEGLHILFMGGMVMGVWLILSGIEGYAGGAGDLFFSSLDSMVAGVGTFIYVMLTLSVVIGFAGMVSRGS